MRSIAYAIALLLLNSVVCAQSRATPNVANGIVHREETYCPWTHDLEGAPEEEHWLEGTIGNRTVRMYLHRAGADVVGLFYPTDGDWTQTFLGGEWSDKKITFSAESATQVPKGRMEVQLLNSTFVGSWTPEGSDHSDPVRLTIMDRPACDGSGVWKRFDDPRWPVSFSYPASWRIEVRQDALVLTCPDPKPMTSGDVVNIYMGTVQEGKPVGPWELVNCANGWRFGRSCGNSEGNTASLNVSKVSQRPDRTILDIENEWRVYCSDGGYVGLGDGEDRVVLLHDSWIEFIGAGSALDIVDRLVKSVRLRTAPDAK